MRLRKNVFLLSVILFSLILLCCDQYEFGQMTEAETNALYCEIEEDIEKGDLWSFEIKYDYNDEDIEDNLLFLQKAINTVFKHRASTSSIRGSWRKGKNSFVSENRISLLYITCEVPFHFETYDYLIDSIIIEKYSKTERFTISLYYHKTGIESNSSSIVLKLTR